MGKIVSVYEHFVLRATFRNELSSWTEVWHYIQTVVFFLYPASQPARHVAHTAQSLSHQIITCRYCRKVQNVRTLNADPTPDCGVAVAKYFLWLSGVFLAHSFTPYSERILPRTHAHTHTHTHTRTHTRTHARTHTHAHTHTRTHAHAHAHPHARTRARTHTHTHAHPHT